MVLLITVILAGIIGVFMARSNAYQQRRWRGYYGDHDTSVIPMSQWRWRAVPTSLVIGVVVGLVATLFFIMTNGSTDDKRTPVRQDIVALGDTTSTNGRFFLGSGTIETGPAYFYYTGNEQDGFRARMHNGNSAEVKYTTGQPHVVFWCRDWRKHADWITSPLLPHWSDEPNIDYRSDTGCGQGSFATFYVPRGSVKQNYTLDAE